MQILIVEDEILIAIQLQEMVTELGFSVVEVATSLAQAIQATDRDDLDLAILDINIAGEKVFAVADRLNARSVPFIFASGYGLRGVPERFHGRLALQKPYSLATLRKALSQMCPTERSSTGGA